MFTYINMAAGITQGAGRHLILYDGICGLCNRLNRLVLSRDRHEVFRFASIQSACGHSLLKQFGRNSHDLDTLYVISDYQSDAPVLMERARAVLFIQGFLGMPFKWISVLLDFLPDRLLNTAYGFVARHRYHILGRHERCLLPDAKHKSRFIDV